MYIPDCLFTITPWNKFSGLKYINISKMFEVYFQIPLLKDWVDF